MAQRKRQCSDINNGPKDYRTTRVEDISAWFLDADYDGKTFRICQAFFPGDPDAWEKLQRALRV